MTGDADLLWRVEMACREAWPAAEEYDIGGWRLRFTDDATRRTGSLNPLPGAAAPDGALLVEAEAFYGKRGHPAFVRLPDFLGLSDAAMLGRGYMREAPTRTLYASAIVAGDDNPANVEITETVSPDWLAARVRIAGGSPEAFAATLALINTPTLLALLRESDEVISVAYGVIVDGLLVVEAVATDPAFRGRGHARRMLSALMAEASRNGARDAVLQVVADNAPAIALYARLGFSEDLYGYSYYRQPLT